MHYGWILLANQDRLEIIQCRAQGNVFFVNKTEIHLITHFWILFIYTEGDKVQLIYISNSNNSYILAIFFVYIRQRYVS